MLQIRRILQLLEQGTSKRQIAQILHSGRHTIDDYVFKIEQSGLSLPKLIKLSDGDLAALVYSINKNTVTDPRYEYIKVRLDYFLHEITRTGVTRLRLWEEYRQEAPDGYSYSQFCDHLSRHSQKSSATMHFEHKPGERVQVDFAGKPLFYIDSSTGEVIVCPVLVCVLPFSGYTYVEALQSARQEHFFPALGRCMSYFGGVPQNVLSDNMRQFVSKSNRYEPVFSELCEQWSLHYRTTLSATRIAKPKDKPSVENAVHLAYLRIYAPLRNESFYSLQQLNQGIMSTLALHNRTPFQRRSYSRMDRFVKEEQALLKPLPAEPFLIKHTTTAKVQKNYHVILGEDWHQYSVPYQFIGKQVRIIYDSDEVEVYHNLQRIAVHKRNYRRHGYTTLAEHMPEKHKKYHETRGWDADYFLGRAREMGTCCFDIFNHILKSRTFTEQAYNACLGLLRLCETYGQERFENACKRAMQSPRINYRLIDNILANNLDKQAEDPMTLFPSIPDHENLRGSQAYH
ncbi:MAG: IS21 family transposase [Bacteroidales bacterium]|nr:IS21 family transposase [Bacteroidales bacterium]